ncbi:hypothetical protein BVH74_12850 [Halopseudomonas phragmitis]|uniref:DUF2970 domain-containing protein n=3 Tax=Pseudomonadales TaxID=72274 RepID=A0A1V0B6L5_9GAMM|nr:hypothetical protein BVH74_12850 [Halopseudomonas phragmitis]RHW22549.1 DUF2970 domain-containing protein [Pseudomonas jilinensis]
MSNDQHKQQQPEQPQPPMRFRDTLSSVLWAALGVHSNKARERDFTQGKPSHFIILGIAFTALFVLTIFGLVKLILHLAGV